MRLAMITSAPFPPREGVGFYVWNLSRCLVQAGHTVHIITRGRRRYVKEVMADGLSLWEVPFIPIYPIHVQVHALFVQRLLRAIAHRIDLVHLHSPLVAHPEVSCPSLVTIHTPMRADVGSIAVSSPIGLLAKLQGPISYKIEQRLFNQGSRLAAVSRQTADDLSPYGIDPQQVAVMGNGVDTTLFKPPPNEAKRARPTVLTVGRLGPRKGLMDLLSCARFVCHELPAAQFFIIGSGPEERDVGNQIARLGLGERVHLLGHISERDQLASRYRDAAVYLHPAHYEGLPTALLEAMACGCPPVATAVGGVPELIRDGENGRLVPPKMPQALAKAVIQLLENPSTAASMGASAAKLIASRYSWARICSDYVTLYQELVSNGAS